MLSAPPVLCFSHSVSLPTCARARNLRVALPGLGRSLRAGCAWADYAVPVRSYLRCQLPSAVRSEAMSLVSRFLRSDRSRKSATMSPLPFPTMVEIPLLPASAGLLADLLLDTHSRGAGGEVPRNPSDQCCYDQQAGGHAKGT